MVDEGEHGMMIFDAIDVVTNVGLDELAMRNERIAPIRTGCAAGVFENSFVV
jgi:hypothetical protein